MRGFGNGARRNVGDGVGNRLDMRRRSAAATAGDVDEAAFGEILKQRRSHVRGFVKAGIAHRIGQAGVGINTDEGVGNFRQFFCVRPHQCRTQCAVEANRQRLGVPDRIPESRYGLSRQDASGGIGHGTGNHDRQAQARFFKEGIDGEQRCLAIQCIENGFDQQYVGAAFYQAAGLFQIRRNQLVEGDITCRRIIHVRRDRCSFRCRSECAGDEARFIGR